MRSVRGRRRVWRAARRAAEEARDGAARRAAEEARDGAARRAAEFARGGAEQAERPKGEKRDKVKHIERQTTQCSESPVPLCCTCQTQGALAEERC